METKSLPPKTEAHLIIKKTKFIDWTIYRKHQMKRKIQAKGETVFIKSFGLGMWPKFTRNVAEALKIPKLFVRVSVFLLNWSNRKNHSIVFKSILKTSI